MSQSPSAETNQADRELPLSGVILTDLLQSVLAKGGSFRFRAKGTSMYPFIRDGDIIVISPLGRAVPRLGDVVACLRPNADRFTVHRILQKQRSSFLIRGDNSPCDDGWFARESILGRVVQVERKGREVRFGLGTERLPIVALARLRWLTPVVHCSLWGVILPMARKMGL